MPAQPARPTLSEKGLLTPDNCVVAMIDLQPQMLFGVGSHDRQTIINSNLILAKAAQQEGVSVDGATVDAAFDKFAAQLGVSAMTLREALARQAAWRGGQIEVREVLVMSSELTPQGPNYTILSRGKLG